MKPSIRKIYLTNGSCAIVDKEDFDYLKEFSWNSCRRGLVARTIWDKKNKKYDVIYLHRLITKAPKGLCVDHVNGNRLDNRKCNLRLCTQLENARNRRVHKNNILGIKGVSRCWNKFTATIQTNKKRYYLGLFKTKKEASRAYFVAAKRLHGEFAHG